MLTRAEGNRSALAGAADTSASNNVLHRKASSGRLESEATYAKDSCHGLLAGMFICFWGLQMASRRCGLPPS